MTDDLTAIASRLRDSAVDLRLLADRLRREAVDTCWEGLAGDAARRAASARAGGLDADAVDAVLTAAGQRPGGRRPRPAGLTDRQVEVLRLLARGASNRQIGAALGISARTAEHHVQDSYARIGVSTRAAAALFAMEHGLLGESEHPLPGRSG